MSLPDDLFTTCEGFLSLPEAELLHELACGVPADAKILEVGSYRARSTCALAFGAKEAGALVYAVDSHPTYEAGGVQFGMADNQAYYANIAHYGLGDVIRTINLPSSMVWNIWLDNIALLFIDGDHQYEQVHRDFALWSLFAETVVMHDTAGYHPGVTKVVEEILASGEWICVKIVDSMSVFKRVENA